MTQYPQRTRTDQRHNPHGRDEQPQINDLLHKIVFTRSGMPEDIFSDIAKEAAKIVRGDTRNNKNKRTQLRRFYDELVMWNDSVQQSEERPEKYAELAPFIKMLKAKVVYAEGRNHVDKNFEKLFSHCINEIKSPETLRHCKFFMEAFMGYYKTLE